MKETLGFLIFDVARLMRRAYQQKQNNSCLTLAQARALLYVAKGEGVRQVDLAEALEVKPITLARLLDELEKNGLVERRRDPQDRRAHQVYLTSAAQPHLASIKKVIEVIRNEALSDLTEEQIENLLFSLEKMRASLLSDEL
ncbi:MarR family winged helix-turn-helix transcriptional regulator [Neptunomonas antarctica]|uniref:DNA-binding transcriptional regulator, MarR family n=1 Tax=Neptunomonas antarctica TaxID=619304 RepID=A0A1N7KV65_9GAMM|nr:MarR family transcriptional regulator [Neptunomonas antarctica]SIS65493.1 DNA-binding transcriptional regulator, MarR family [Neptunomonas antarctica]